MRKMKLDKKELNKKSPTYIVAEISANHCQSLKKAIKLIEIAKNCGADAVKIQTFKPESLAIKNILKKKRDLNNNSPWKKFNNRYELFKKAQLPYKWHKLLFQKAKKIGITLFSSPFDLEAVDLLEELNCPIYKIASPEITDIPLIAKVAKTKKPVIVSLGLAKIQDINLAVSTLKKHGCKNFILLKCQSHYPADPSKLNLKSIKILEKKYKCPIGFSDHTLGIGSSIAAVLLGARVIEKHIKYYKEKKSLDAFFSLEPNEFKQMVKEIRVAEKSVGKSSLKIDPKTLRAMNGRKSILVNKNINKGEILSEKNIKIVRPAYGLHPKYYNKILGKKVNKKLHIGQSLKLNYII
tara:strand:- start:198 stop:1253 length:1056 start_codon:yes stop_codon:yes gene_type:complete